MAAGYVHTVLRGEHKDEQAWKEHNSTKTFTHVEKKESLIRLGPSWAIAQL